MSYRGPHCAGQAGRELAGGVGARGGAARRDGAPAAEGTPVCDCAMTKILARRPPAYYGCDRVDRYIAACDGSITVI